MAPKPKTGVYELGGGLCVGVRCVKNQAYACIQKSKPGVGKNRMCVLLSKKQLKNLVEANDNILVDLESVLGFMKKTVNKQDSSTQTEELDLDNGFSREDISSSELVVEPPTYNIEDSYSYLKTMPTIDELLQALCGPPQP